MARYSEEIINDVRQSNDIVDVISQYVHLKRSGRNFFGLCPFHNEKTPSFSICSKRQLFKCFACGESGGIFEFVEKYVWLWNNKNGSVEKLKLRESQKEFFGDVGE